MKPSPPVLITRRAIVLGGAIIGLGIAIALAGAGIALLLISDQVDANQETNARQRESIRALKDVTERLNRLTNPTPAEYRRQLERGIRRCLKEPKCRALFPRLRDVADLPDDTTAESVPASSGSPDGERRAAVRRPAGGGPVGEVERPSGPQRPPPDSSPSPSPSPPSPRPPERLVDIDAPAPVDVCVDGIIGINC